MATETLATAQGYLLDNRWEHARHRLELLEQCYDAGTIRRLDNLGVRAGWRCLEVGAGGGSITRWLCARVRPAGHVLATDLDTRFVEELDDENLDVCRLDLRTDKLPADAFDLVHVRLVLMHIPQREQVLDALVASVRPGGWLLVEEGDYFAELALGTGLYREVMKAGTFAMIQGGVPHDWARHLPGSLHRRGLTGIGTDCEVPLFEGGSPGADWRRVTVSQLWEQGRIAGITAGQLAEWNTLLSQPGRWFPGLAMVAAWGRRP